MYEVLVRRILGCEYEVGVVVDDVVCCGEKCDGFYDILWEFLECELEEY